MSAGDIVFLIDKELLPRVAALLLPTSSSKGGIVSIIVTKD